MKMNTKILIVLIFGVLILNSCSVHKNKIYVDNTEDIWTGNILSYENTYIKTKNFEGVIFSKDYFVLIGSSEKFTPTTSDIEFAEMILQKGIEEINVNKYNQVINNCPVIHKNLKKI